MKIVAWFVTYDFYFIWFWNLITGILTMQYKTRSMIQYLIPSDRRILVGSGELQFSSNVQNVQ